MIDMINVNQVKQNNILQVKRALRTLGQSTKNSVARVTGLSVTTCNTILNELVETNEALLIENSTSSIGRPAKQFLFNSNLSYICCLYFSDVTDGIQLHYAITDLMGNFIAESSCTHAQIDMEFLVSTIQQLKNKYDKIQTLSIGIPGYYYNHRISACGQVFLDGCDLIEELQKHFPMNIYVENDINAMAYGIYYYRSDIVEKHENLALIAFIRKSSLGAGTIINGEILRGNTSFAGEVLKLCYPGGDGKQLLSSGTDGIIQLASNLIVTYSVIVNPSVVVFTGNNITQEIIDKAKEKAIAYVGIEHIPRLIYKDDFEKYYLQGLSAIALNHMLTLNI